MKRQRAKNILIFGTMLLLVILASLVRVKWQSNDPLIFALQSVGIFSVYVGIIAYWGVSVHLRIVHKQMRTLIFLIVWEMLLWIVLRTLRHTVFYNVQPFGRWCWYGYYIPMILIPPQLFMIANCLGKTENNKIPKSYSIIFIPAVLLIIGVLTNDLHGLAFSFPDPFGRGWDLYTHSILYYIIVVWIIVFVLRMLILLPKKSRIPDSNRLITLPMLALLLGVVYTVIYIISDNRFGFIEMTMFFCMLVIVILESCIYTGLIPSNTYYGELFNASDISAQILDKNNDRVYSSVDAPYLGDKNLIFSEDNSFRLDSDRLLKRSCVNGGMVYWIEDISDMNRIINELANIEENITEENDILCAEIELEQKRAKLEEQNQLYDEITKVLAPRLDKAKELLVCTDAADKDFKQKLSYISLLFAHIKRRANLIILARNQSSLRLDELIHSIKESANYIVLTGCQCSFDYSFGDTTVNAEALMLAYDTFEDFTESAISGLRAMLIKLTEQPTGFILKVNADSHICDFQPNNLQARARELGCDIKLEAQGEEYFFTFEYRGAGDSR